MMLSCKVSLYAYRRLPYHFPHWEDPPKKEARRLLASSSPKMEGGEKAAEGSLHYASENRRNEGAT